MSSLLSIITPTNLEREKEKFFYSRTYNPQFTYDRNIPELKEKLSHVRKVSRDFFYVILDKQYELISERASEFFETAMDPDIMAYAHHILSKHKPTQDHTEEHLGTVIRAFQDAFSFFDIDYRLTVTKTEGFNFRPAHRKRTLLISHKAQFQYLPLDGAVLHEMVHVIRYLNGLQNKVAFRWRHLPTEEGLACYIQDYRSKHGKVSLYQHAAEYAATEVALKGSLRDVYDFFRDHGFDEEFAWGRAVRHKFGFTDTSHPGDIMKPAMYFFNEQKIKTMTHDELIRLFVGKIKLTDLSKHPTYKGVFSQEKIEQFFRLKKNT
jgi:hypothetical protein